MERAHSGAQQLQNKCSLLFWVYPGRPPGGDWGASQWSPKRCHLVSGVQSEAWLLRLAWEKHDFAQFNVSSSHPGGRGWRVGWSSPSISWVNSRNSCTQRDKRVS